MYHVWTDFSSAAKGYVIDLISNQKSVKQTWPFVRNSTRLSRSKAQRVGTFSKHFLREKPWGRGCDSLFWKCLWFVLLANVITPCLTAVCFISFFFYFKVTFLKDRVIAEQVAKDSLEAMLQGDVDNIRVELGMTAYKKLIIRQYLM